MSIYLAQKINSPPNNFIFPSQRAPQPFKCAPKSQYPVTGFWDEANLEENHKTAFSSQIGRVDIEGDYEKKMLPELYLPCFQYIIPNVKHALSLQVGE